nr:hypothetical protein HCOI_01693300 [Haemonchus contortus]
MNFSPNEDIDDFVNSLKARTLDANFKGIRHEILECLAPLFDFHALADYLLDTGAHVITISRPTWMQLGGPQLQKTSDTLRGANGLPLRIYGKFDAAFVVIDNRGKAHPGPSVCYVPDDYDLLEITWIEQIPDFNLVLKRFNVGKV